MKRSIAVLSLFTPLSAFAQGVNVSTPTAPARPLPVAISTSTQAQTQIVSTHTLNVSLISPATPKISSSTAIVQAPAISSATAQKQVSQPAPIPLDGISQAKLDYQEGLIDFKNGQDNAGREKMADAFSIVISRFREPGLPRILAPDFDRMLKKIQVSITSNTEHIAINPNDPKVQQMIQLYLRRPKATEAALSRSGMYRDMIMSALKKKGLPPELFYLVMAESEFKDDALSRSGAAGLWQFMPGTAVKYGLKVSYWEDDRYDPQKETMAAIHYLSDLRRWFGDWALALAAYNRGEGGLGYEMKMSRSLNFGTLSSRGALPTQTNFYVPKFEACVLIGENPEKYGFHPQYAHPAAFDTVTIPHALDLGIAARCAQTSESVLRQLNPELRAWCTPEKKSGFTLKIPKGSAKNFETALAQVKDWNPGPTMLRYRIRRGDILGKIARRYHTTISSLIKINHIRRVRSLKPGRTILIRPGIRRVHVRRLARRKHRQSRLARSKKRKKVRG
jgi:hypothetical protein